MIVFHLFFSSIVLIASSNTVQEIVLSLGESRDLAPQNCQVVSGYSSNDTLMSLRISDNSVVVRALEFGSASVTLFCYSGTRHYRIRIPAQSNQIPDSGVTKNPDGSFGALGFNLGVISPFTPNSTRVYQEEFVRYSERHEAFTQSGAVSVLDPIYYPQPKPGRIIDRVFWEYQSRSSSRVLRFGDLDPFQRGANGVVRGARFDTGLFPHALNLWAGVLRSGLDHPLLGANATPATGAGWQSLGTIRLKAHTLAFEAHPELGITSSGVEIGFQPSIALGDMGDLELGLLSDKQFRVSPMGSLTLKLNPLAMNVQLSHLPDNFAVFSSPGRFGVESNYYDASTTLQLERSHFGVGISRSLQFTSIDSFPGLSQLENVTSTAHLAIGDNLSMDTSANQYLSSFTPHSLGNTVREEGRRFSTQFDSEISHKQFITLGGTADAIVTTREGASYENQTLALGYRKDLLASRADNIHFQVGASHLYVPDEPNNSGNAFLTRISGLWDTGFLKLDGTIQGESRSGDFNNHRLRIQAGMTFTPTAKHELRLALSHNYDWLRTTFSNTQRASLYYAFRFGTDIASGSIPAHWDRSTISGRVYIDKNYSGEYDESDEGIEGAEIVLDTDGQISRYRTDVFGQYRFNEIPHGNARLTLNTQSLSTLARLASASEHVLPIGAGSQLTQNFVLSDGTELRATLYEDLNSNLKFDGGDLLIPLGKVVIKDLRNNSHEISFENGRFIIHSLPPGQTELIVDKLSLPPGYSAPKALIFQLKPSEILAISLAIQADRGLSGRVFYDVNRNRRWDSNEKGIDGILVHFGKFRTQTGEGGQFLWRHLPPMVGKVTYQDCVSEEVRLGNEPRLLHEVWVPCNVPT